MPKRTSALRALEQLTKTNDSDSDASGDSDYENEDFDSEVDYVESDYSTNDECDDCWDTDSFIEITIEMTIEYQHKLHLHRKHCPKCLKRLDTFKKSHVVALYKQEIINKLNMSRENAEPIGTGDLYDDQDNQVIEPDPASHSRHSINIPRTGASHKKCVICNRLNQYQNLTLISDEAVFHAYVHTGIIIPFKCRACPGHFNEIKLFKESVLQKMTCYKDTTELSKVSLVFFSSISPDYYYRKNVSKYCITGFTRNEYLVILNCIKSMRSSNTRSVCQALAVYLFWLKTGLDRYCQQVRKALTDDFVPLNIGANHLSREKWLIENNTVAKKLHTTDKNQMVFIADGTYCYCEKSSDNQFQRSTFSVQKRRHLVKPFVICSSNGRKVDIYGPYQASLNDAEIMKIILNNDKNLMNLIESKDVFLLDRGFRDCISFLNDRQISTKTPSMTKAKNKQSTFDANMTRHVTKCRWVIKVTNSFLKRSFKALRETQNQMLNHIIDDYRVAGSLVNLFFERLTSDEKDADMIVSKLQESLNKINELEKIVSVLELHKKSKFVKIDILKVDDFPKLSEDQLKLIALGTFGLRMCISYLNEALSDGEFEIQKNDFVISHMDSKIISTRIQSRHTNSTKYKTYIRYNIVKDGSGKIIDSFCDCLSGMRKSGCVHSLSIIYYLSYGRYLDELSRQKVNLRTIFRHYDESHKDSKSSGVQKKNLVRSKLAETKC
ncbi:Vacuolar sorting-associated 13C [Brachionus plicatilis]|uniref:Vacuolar sorting-associated 13C n=1 Tax=Brachionus plicatilis TaxID=10195 RepID=A0A3M7SLM1_BRAPC|nr:Vacuolar sorting-associated 13C [Brachionus plicatilis]